MRGRVIGGGVLVVTALFIAVAGLAGASDQPDPGSVRLGVAVLAVPSLLAGAWLWRSGRRRPVGGSRNGKRLAAAVTGILALIIAPFAALDGETVVAGAFVVTAVGMFGYVAMVRSTRGEDVVVTMLELPTGPERGLRIVVPRAKQLVYVVTTGVIGLALVIMAPAARQEGDGIWWLLALMGVLLLVLSPFFWVRMRGPVGLGISASGVSFTQLERTVLVPWANLERVEVFRMRTGRYGSHVNMVGLYVDDHRSLVGLSDAMRRLARLNRAVGPDLSWPVTMFDLEGEQIVDLVRRYHEDPERRGELASLTQAPSA